MKLKKPLVTSFILALFALILVHKVDFPGSEPHFRDQTGGQILFDIKPAQSQAEMHERMEAMGESGRALYKSRLFTVDALLPLTVTAFLILFMRSVVSKWKLQGFLNLALTTLTLGYLFFDLIENSVLFSLLNQFPNLDEGLVNLTPTITRLKRFSLVGALLVPVTMHSIFMFRKSSHGTQ